MDEERITITLDGLGGITATKDVFNVLAITFSDARKQLHREECFALEAKAEKIRNTIHGTLFPHCITYYFTCQVEKITHFI